MTFDWTVTLGNVLQLVTMIGLAIAGYYAISARMAVFESMLAGHADTLKQHAQRLDLYEARIVEVIGDLQRLIGRMER